MNPVSLWTLPGVQIQGPFRGSQFHIVVLLIVANMYTDIKSASPALPSLGPALSTRASFSVAHPYTPESCDLQAKHAPPPPASMSRVTSPLGACCPPVNQHPS